MDKKRLKGQRILVTGGSGYLGSRLAQVLEDEGALVSCLSRTKAGGESAYSADITDAMAVKNVMEEVKPEIVYHLAANISRSRDFDIFDEMMRVNAYGTLNVLSALKESGDAHFIFTSSSEVYGNTASPFSENQLPKPVSPYSLSKYTAEQIVQTYATLQGIPFTILRLFNFFGKNMPEDFFIPQMVNSLLRGEDFLMTGGAQMRDFLYIDDVSEAMVLAAVVPEARNELFNVCSGTGTRLADLAAHVNQVIDAKARIITGALPYRENEVWEMIGSIDKIREKLGFEPRTSVAEGIQLLLK